MLTNLYFPRLQTDKREIVTGRGDVIVERFLAENLGLNLVDAVAVIADDARQAGLPQLPQLSQSEAGPPLIGFVPEAVSKAQVTESGRYDVRERRAKSAPSSWISWLWAEVPGSLKDAPHEEIDVIDFLVDLPKVGNVPGLMRVF